MMMPMATTLQKTICAVNSSTPKRKATTLANNAIDDTNNKNGQIYYNMFKTFGIHIICRIKFYHFQYLFE